MGWRRKPSKRHVSKGALDALGAELVRLRTRSEPERPKGLSQRDVAEMLGVSRHCLRDARYRNEVKAKRLGKSWLYKRADLLAFLDKQSTSDTGRRTRKP